MFIKINSAAIVGIEARPVTIEIDISKGWPGFQIVGLPDTAIQEAKERIRIAWKNTVYDWPYGKGITINLAPADLRKEGALYDLPMAVGMYLAHQQIKSGVCESALIIGELALDGTVRPINGSLVIASYAQVAGYQKIFLPSQNAQEAQLINGITVYPVNHLSEIIDHISAKHTIKPLGQSSSPPTSAVPHPIEDDFLYIKGQEFAKRALEIAAAGGHNILFSGPPGVGKTMLARALRSILPPLATNEIIDVTKVYSVAGLLPIGQYIIKERPFRSPHHSASSTALIGGGGTPRPGEISLAHHGVLFLDEFSEFKRFVLENLRQPLEAGEITIARARTTITFPADFILVASQNPCPCGYFGDSEKNCTCSLSTIHNYQKRISGPLLDRIDLHVSVPRENFNNLHSNTAPESSDVVRGRVLHARKLQSDRFKVSSITTNHEMEQKEITEFCTLPDSGINLLKNAVERLHLSTRTYFRIIKVARTIADLQAHGTIQTNDIAEALQYRIVH